MADDDLTAALEVIQAEADGSIAYAGAHDCPDTETSCSAHNALRLLAALRAVLELHQPIVRREGWNPTCKYDNHRWPCPEVAAITRALNGAQSSAQQREESRDGA